MKAKFFDQHQSNEKLWRLNWQGLQSFGKQFTSHGFKLTRYYQPQEINEIADIIKSDKLQNIFWEVANSKKTLLTANRDELCAIFKSLPASNSDFY